MSSIIKEIENNAHDENIAIEYNHGQNTITYKRLLERVSQVSNDLSTKHHVLPGDHVVVSIANASIDMYICIIAVLSLDAVYIYVDPTTSKNKYDKIIKDSMCCLIIHEDGICEAKNNTTPTPSSGTDAAYLIYSSGTTGDPKAMRISGSALVKNIKYSIDVFQITHTDRVLQNSPMTFDMAIWQVFVSLCAGATLVCIDEQIRTSPKKFTAFIVHHKVSVMFACPYAIQSLGKTPLPDMRLMMSGGDDCNYSDAIFYSTDTCTFVNMYGPSENTIFASHYKVTKQTTDPVPIGTLQPWVKPWRVLDEDMNDAKEGILYIGGSTLAIDYWQRPDLTSKHFVVSKDGHRMYDTGDIVKKFDDNCLQYIYRRGKKTLIADKVSLRKIASIFETHKDVDCACCVLVTCKDGKDKVVAYIKTQNHDLQKQDIENILKETPPDLCFFLKYFPLTSSGKVDKQALTKYIGNI